MIKLKSILGVTAAFLATVTLQAQTYNDTVRTHTWSLYIQGGASYYHGVRSDLFDNSKGTISPDINLGVKYNIKPWVRIGLNAGYTMLESTGKNILSTTTTNPNFTVGDRPATLEKKSDRLQNRNNMDLLGADINVDFNILAIWPKRKAQWLNMYAGVGVGYMHGWNRNSQTWSYHEKAVAQGEDYGNLYTHSYMESFHNDMRFDALYIPASLSLEFDVARRLTLGVIGQYKYLPMDKAFTPKGIYNAGIVIRYNFVKSKSKLQRKQIADLYSQLDVSRSDCISEMAALRQQAAENESALKTQSEGLKQQLKEVNDVIAAKEKEAYAIIYFENNSWDLSPENTKRLEQLGKQLKANPEIKILLIGSANTVGRSDKNKNLSDNRLNSVKQFLTIQGVDPAQFGSEVSLGDRGMTNDSECRRVIIVTK